MSFVRAASDNVQKTEIRKGSASMSGSMMGVLWSG